MVLIEINPQCPYLETWPLLLAGCSILAGAIVIPLICFLLFTVDGVGRKPKNQDMCGQTCKIPSISKTWRQRYTTGLVMNSIVVPTVIYNVCVNDTYVIVFINLYAFVLLVINAIDPEDDNDTHGIYSSAKNDKLIQWEGSAHFCMAGFLFILNYAMNILMYYFYYRPSQIDEIYALGIFFLVVNTLIFCVFIVVVILYARSLVVVTFNKGKRQVEQLQIKNGPSEWSSAVDTLEIIFSIFTLLTAICVHNNLTN